MSTPATDDRDETIRSLEQDVHLLREELAGIRQMLDGSMAALQGAQRAYASVAQRADLLDTRLRKFTSVRGF